MPHRYPRVALSIMCLAIIASLLPLAALPARAASQLGQACQSLASPVSRASSASRDRWKFSDQRTLTYGAVIGFDAYLWTEEPDSSADVFRATTDEAVFLAGDYPAATPLGTVWDELCPVLVEMGFAIVEQGVEPEGSLYAVVTMANADGGEQHGIVRVLYGYGTDVPVFAILTAPADGFSVAISDADGLGINGMRVFEDLDGDAMLATLQNGGTVTEPAASQQETTLGSGTVVGWADPWGDPYIEANSVNLVSADGTVLNVMAFPVGEHSVESAAALTPASGQYTVLASGAEEGGVFSQLSVQTIFDPMLGDERTFFVYARAWPSADGQWIILTQLQSMTPYFTRDLVSIPQAVTLDGAALWTEIDPAMIVAIVSEAGVDMSSEEPVPADQQAATTSTTTTSTASGPGASPRDILASVPLGGPGEGRAQEGAYTSDLFGYTIAWDAHWTVYPAWTSAADDAGYDTWALETTEDGYAALIISGAAWDDQDTVEDYVAYWTSDDFLEEHQTEGTEVILADATRRSGAVVLVGPASEDDDELWVTVYEIAVIDRALKVESTFAAPLAGFADAYEDARASVTFDGDEAIGFFAVDEIVAELP